MNTHKVLRSYVQGRRLGISRPPADRLPLDIFRRRLGRCVTPWWSTKARRSTKGVEPPGLRVYCRVAKVRARKMAPRSGLEPLTSRLTAVRSAD